MKKTVSTGFINFNVTVDICNSQSMIENGYISDDIKVYGLCRRNDLLDYTIVFNSDYNITTEIILHEVYHLFFDVLNDIGRNDTFSAKELGKDLYCYMFVDMFNKAMKIVQKELNTTKKWINMVEYFFSKTRRNENGKENYTYRIP